MRISEWNFYCASKLRTLQLGILSWKIKLIFAFVVCCHNELKINKVYIIKWLMCLGNLKLEKAVRVQYEKSRDT